MSIDIGKVSVPVNQNDGQPSIDPKRIRADILSGQFDEISVISNERRVNPEVVQIPITLTSQEEIIGLLALKGAQGTSIASITKTGTSGLVDTYTILMTDGTTATFEVTNGEKGDPGSSIVSITKTGTSGLVDTYTILMSDGNTSTFTVTNGSGGSWGSITGTLSDQTDLQDALDTKVNTADLGDLASKDTVDWDTDIDNIPATFPPSVHNHDDRYYTETEVDAKLQPMYGYCETASNVVAKTVSISNFTLVTGRTVFIKFEYENTADDPTLNISNTGAISIVRYGTDPASEDEIKWSDGEVKCFTYDGTSWIESGGAGGSDREDTISFHGSDMIVEPGTNRITFDDSDMIIHPPDGAAWLERTMEALEGGIAIISTNNEHAAISNGQYVYIRMHETLPDGLYKATADIAQNAELSALNVTSASGALNYKSDVDHTHDDRYYTETETDNLLSGKSANANIGIVENTNNATHNISEKQYVVWKGSLYTAKSDISSGATLSSSNLEAVNNGGINEILYKVLPGGISLNIGDNRDSAQINNQDFYRIGNVVFFKVSLKNATIQSAVNSWRTFLNITPKPAFDVTFNASYQDTKFLGAIAGANGVIYVMTDTLFSNKYLSIWGNYRI